MIFFSKERAVLMIVNLRVEVDKSKVFGVIHTEYYSKGALDRVEGF